MIIWAGVAGKGPFDVPIEDFMTPDEALLLANELTSACMD
jgi:hypothetical protein